MKLRRRATTIACLAIVAFLVGEGQAASQSTHAQRTAVVRWKSVSRASYYRFVLWQDGKRVLSLRPSTPRVTVATQVGPGRYRWYAYPGYGSKALHRYGQLVARGVLLVPAIRSSPTGYYEWEHFDDRFNLGLNSSGGLWWSGGGGGGETTFVSDGSVNQAMRITLPGASQSETSQSYGQAWADWVDARYAHAGYVAGQDTTTGNGKEEDTWYRFRFRAPIGFQPTAGTQNSLWEVHVDDKTAQEMASYGQAARSTMLLIRASGVPSLWNTQPGTKPRFELQAAGGATNDPAGKVVADYAWSGNTLKPGRWYDFVIHAVWAQAADGGRIQLWENGVKVLDVARSMNYTRSDGTYSFGECAGLYYYRHWASWPASVDYDEFVLGPTAVSVGFAG
jgi:hypothetical protein